ncbi:MAG: ATP-binding protein, partial [Thermodesulfobacteriota bacterium]
MTSETELGLITRGSLVEGLEMKLSPERSIEEIKVGKFVVIEGLLHRFFSLITDVRLDSSSPDALTNPPSMDDEVMRSVLAGTSTYATVELRPMLTIHQNSNEPSTVKTVPPHFAQVKDAAEPDVSTIFGKEDNHTFFNIGTPIDMTTPVCLNLDKFVERSNGIFGKTGSGKTFLTRLVLAGIIKNDRAVNLIFDMHNEYGWSATTEGGEGFVKGLKQLFGDRVAIFSLDPDSTRKRGRSPDMSVYISPEQIEIEDIVLLQEELNLSATAVESAFAIYKEHRTRWLSELLSWEQEDIPDIAKELGAHSGSLGALHRKLRRLKNLPFLVDSIKKAEDAIGEIIKNLERGINIVLEFGAGTQPMEYILVANMITRRIYDRYIDKTENYQSTQNPADKPKHLMITIEEAHKFLSPYAAKQTIFGTIARELRKYSVTMLVVDQRPSGIDDEIISQIGTRLTAQLNDEKDIQAVLTGVHDPSALRSLLSTLESKQQVLLFGHALPMPIQIKTRTYDEEFYKDMASSGPQPEEAEKFKKEMY